MKLSLSKGSVGAAFATAIFVSSLMPGAAEAACTCTCKRISSTKTSCSASSSCTTYIPAIMDCCNACIAALPTLDSILVAAPAAETTPPAPGSPLSGAETQQRADGSGS